MFGLDFGLSALLFLCIFCVCVFEFINGFHDTANAVATVIYTNSLKPRVAVILSGSLNFLGVFAGGIGVAVGIINLLPIETLVNQDIHQSISMIMALLLTAIIWNLGTWYYGIPCSSSHTLIGAILGVGLGYGWIVEGAESVNWGKASEIGLSLVISPLLGFGLTMLMMFLLKIIVRDQQLFEEPPKGKTPPTWIRSILILTCSGVSFTHGSNDGQKGVGLVMLILIAIVPTYFAINNDISPKNLQANIANIKPFIEKIDGKDFKKEDLDRLEKSKKAVLELESISQKTGDLPIFPEESRFQVRKNILLLNKNFGKLLDIPSVSFDKKEEKMIQKEVKSMKDYTDFAPSWVLIIISVSLGLGTTIGWKRIVETIGEKIGKQHLTYAQGASSELVAAGTIAISTFFGLPVSTTQVLSSGIAGSMVASGGLQNLQASTLKNIALAWLLTLPVCVSLSAILFMIFSFIF
ncbi:MAG: anion permease [Bacteroidetes bacterium]|nr:MAG: anion permease [Bacteroidota bacterium]